MNFFNLYLKIFLIFYLNYYIDQIKVILIANDIVILVHQLASLLDQLPRVQGLLQEDIREKVPTIDIVNEMTVEIGEDSRYHIILNCFFFFVIFNNIYINKFFMF